LEKLLTPLPERFEIPNAFTPDGDKYNERFAPVFFGNGKVLQMTIWNRWGQIVFQSNQANASWNGTRNADGESPCPMDVYLYLMEIQMSDGSITTRKGQVMLIR
jgi:gliding motility-associated-like protein